MDIININWGVKVCLSCCVMWGFEGGSRCWWCRRPGLTLAEYESRRLAELAVVGA